MGIYYNLGFARLINIDSKFEQDTYGDKGIPDVFLSYGLGFGIYM